MIVLLESFLLIISAKTKLTNAKIFLNFQLVLLTPVFTRGTKKLIIAVLKTTCTCHKKDRSAFIIVGQKLKKLMKFVYRS